MQQNLYYRDYFSLKTLNKFGVNPDTQLDLQNNPSKILSTFGKVNAEDKKFLLDKINAAYSDMGIEPKAISKEAAETGDLSDRVRMSLDELDDKVYIANDDVTSLEEDIPQLDEEPIVSGDKK